MAMRCNFVWCQVPSMEAVSFLRELVAYYTLLESSSAVSLAAASEPPKDSYISLLSLDTHNDRASSVTGASGYCMPIDSHTFTNGLATPCTLYGTMVIIFSYLLRLPTRLSNARCLSVSSFMQKLRNGSSWKFYHDVSVNKEELIRFWRSSASGSWAQIHRYCLKIYPRICHKITLRQKLYDVVWWSYDMS